MTKFDLEKVEKNYSNSLLIYNYKTTKFKIIVKKISGENAHKIVSYVTNRNGKVIKIKGDKTNRLIDHVENVVNDIDIENNLRNITSILFDKILVNQQNNN